MYLYGEFPLILQLHFRLLRESNAGYDIRVTDRNMSLYNVQFVIGYYKNVYLHKLETKQHVLVKSTAAIDVGNLIVISRSNRKCLNMNSLQYSSLLIAANAIVHKVHV